MESIVFLICAAAFLQCQAQGRLDVSQDGIMGVSQEKLKDYFTKAIEGFREMMPLGDEHLDYAIMDPYPLEDISWDYVDKSANEKYRVNFLITNATVIKGLSNFYISDIQINAITMELYLRLVFSNLQTEFPYKLQGHMFKDILPMWGEGVVKLSAPVQALTYEIDLGIEQSYIVVEDVEVSREFDIDIQVTGLMDFPQPFADLLVDDILNQIIQQHGDKALTRFVRESIEEAVGGMTIEEFFDYLDHFVKIKDQQ